MKKVGIFYGSTTGATEGVAETIAARLGVASEDIHNVGTTKVDGTRVQFRFQME